MMRKGQIGARHVAWMRGAFERMRKPAKASTGKKAETGREVRVGQAEALIRREPKPCHA